MPLSKTIEASHDEKHQADVNTLVYYNDRIFSGGDDGHIKIWYPDLKCHLEVAAHPSSVYSIAAGDNLLFSCSNDGSIKEWDINTLQDKGTIHNFDSEILKLFYADGILYAADDQGSINMFKNGKHYATASILEQVRDLFVSGDRIYSAKDLDLVVTDVYPGESDLGRFSTQAVLPGRAPLTLIDNKLCYTTRDGKGLLVTDNRKESQHKLITEVKDAHELIINALAGSKDDTDTYIYTGGWDKILKQWRVTFDRATLEGQLNTDIVINAIATGTEGQIYVGGTDGRIIRIDSS